MCPSAPNAMRPPEQLTSTDGHLVHHLVDDQAVLDPSRIALSLDGQTLTYEELESRSRFLAERLRGEGIGHGDLVGVFLDRSFDLIASFLGILKIGAAYVPLDTNYPQERISFMAGDTGMKRILSTSTLARRLPVGGTELLILDETDAEHSPPVQWERRTKEARAHPDQLAYVMYTSGSTGVPKGVAIPHRGIVRLVCEPDYVQIAREDVFLQVSPVSFDASTFEIWGALTNGARLVLMPPGQPSLQQIGEIIRKEHVSVLWLTAGLFNLMVDERLSDLAPVKQLLAGGDALSVPHVRRALAALPHTQLINGYGPTENTTFTCCHAIPRDLSAVSSVPIGRPIRGTTVHVMDDQLAEVADGEEGELLTGGLGLAIGYWNRPQATAERFIRSPFSKDPTARLYRTGDRVRQLPDGNLEFLGRTDNQVKLRGFRIELGEVESTIRQHPDLRDCAVTVWADALGNKSLAAWVVPKPGHKCETRSLRSHVETYLPEHMRPALWTFLDELPLNPNGKVDRARLSAPAFASDTIHREPPATDLERSMVELWQGLLGGRPVGVTESYFELGASSLLVAQAYERLCRRHKVSLQLTDLFRFTTVRTLANHLQGIQSPSMAPTEVASDRAQRRIAALHRFKKAYGS